MYYVVFVNSIVKDESGSVTIEASNASRGGPPLVRFGVTGSAISDFYIGKKLSFTVSVID